MRPPWQAWSRPPLPAPPFPMASDVSAALNVRDRGQTGVGAIAKNALAVAAAWLLSRVLLGAEAPTFAALTALVVTQRSLFATFGLGIQQVLGVVLGVTWGGIVVYAMGSSTPALFVGVLVAMLTARYLPFGAAATGQLPVSTLLMIALADSDAGVASERIREAMLGGATGLVTVLLLLPTVRYVPAEAALAAWSSSVRDGLRGLAFLLRSPARDAATALTGLEALLEGMQRLRDRATNEVYVVFDEARSHPLARGVDRERLARISKEYTSLQVIDSQVVQLARVVMDRIGRMSVLPLRVDPVMLSGVVDRIAAMMASAVAGKDVTDEARLLKRQLEVMAEDASRGRTGSIGGLLDGLGVLGVLEQVRREAADEVLPTETDLMNWSTVQIQSLRGIA